MRPSGPGRSTPAIILMRVDLPVIILGQSRARAWPRKTTEKRRSNFDLRGCWPRNDRSAAIERRGGANVERLPTASPQLSFRPLPERGSPRVSAARREDMQPAAGAEQIALDVDFHASGTPSWSPSRKAQTSPPDTPSCRTSNRRMCLLAVSLIKRAAPFSARHNPFGSSKSSTIRMIEPSCGSRR